MSEPDYSNVQDVNVPQEASHAEAIDAQMRRTSDNAAITSVTATAINDAAQVGATYDQAEVNAVRDQLVAVNARLADTVAALNLALEVLREAELIPSS